MAEQKNEVLENVQATRRTVLKRMLVGLGAGVIVQASGGVFAGDLPVEPGKIEKNSIKKPGEGAKKIEKMKIEKAKSEQNKESKSKGGNEKRKAEEPKNQRK